MLRDQHYIYLNGYRWTADILHLISVIYLLVKLIKTKSCGGFSGKSQLLFAVGYTARYLDIWVVFISVYNFSFKVIYLICYWTIVGLIFIIFRNSYRNTKDTFLTELLLIPSFLLALWFNHGMYTLEILWAFSIYLESVAILPQFYMIFKEKEIQKSLIYYLVPHGLYRLFYIFNWIYRWLCENHEFDKIADSAGLLYVAIHIIALVVFINIKVQITDDVGTSFLRKNIIYILGDSSKNETMISEEKKIDEKNLLETA